jgi:hypothetical protein
MMWCDMMWIVDIGFDMDVDMIRKCVAENVNKCGRSNGRVSDAVEETPSERRAAGETWRRRRCDGKVLRRRRWAPAHCHLPPP